ncbi:MAG: UDP-glucose 4-epimerase GalE [Bacteroidetes bacterium]|nr:UDP-glucose 4-epimerase GalE [Bacteroidota bacterium]
MSKILVTGGAGYIGSHTIIDLLDHGYEVVSIDDFKRSLPSALENIQKVTGTKITNYDADLCDRAAVEAIFDKEKDISGIIHFAALKSVPESVLYPLMYYHNNLESLVILLDIAQQRGIRQFVFSSSCSVYGNASELPVTEMTPLQEAESPYARTKQISEKIIEDHAKVADMKYVVLRYFNPVGAHESALIGENPKDGLVFNIFPRITGTALGQYDHFDVFGSDYPTRDGTCVRDYIHVMDIAHAHTLAIQQLDKDADAPKYDIYNLGTGHGVTVMEVIHAFERVSGVKLNYKLQPRRAGDVVAIYANNEKAKNKLGWTATRDLDTMLHTAWHWENNKRKTS